MAWLSAHTGFPARRLEKRAELLLCFGLLAEADEVATNQRHLIQSKDVARDAALRAHNMRRNQVHYVCDNSAKV